MASGKRAAKATGYGEDVIRLTVMAVDAGFALGGAFSGDRDNDGGVFGEGDGFAAGEGAAVGSEAAADAAIKFFGPGDGCVGGQGDSDEDKRRSASHGGKVAEHAGDGLPANFVRRGIGKEVNAFDDGIGFQESQWATAGIDDCAIVARPGDEGWVIIGKTVQESGDEGVFAEVRESFHG